jgi:hypothetical protein
MVLALGHNGLMEAVAKVFRELIHLVIAVNLDGFLGRIHYHVAFVAPMEVFIQLGPEGRADFAVKIIGQLL